MFYSLEPFSVAMQYTSNSRLYMIQNTYKKYITWIENNFDRNLDYSGWWSSKLGGLLFHMQLYINIYNFSYPNQVKKIKNLKENFMKKLIQNFKNMSFQHNVFTFYSITKLQNKNIFSGCPSFEDKTNYFYKETKYSKLNINRTIDNMIFTVKPKNNKVKIAFYIYKNDIKVDTQWYSHNYTYVLNKKYGDGKYLIKYFIVNETEKNLGKAQKIEIDFFPLVHVDNFKNGKVKHDSK